MAHVKDTVYSQDLNVVAAMGVIEGDFGRRTSSEAEKSSLDRERVQLHVEINWEIFEKEREIKKQRVDKMKRVAENHVKTKLVNKTCTVDPPNEGHFGASNSFPHSEVVPS